MSAVTEIWWFNFLVKVLSRLLTYSMVYLCLMYNQNFTCIGLFTCLPQHKSKYKYKYKITKYHLYIKCTHLLLGIHLFPRKL